MDVEEARPAPPSRAGLLSERSQIIDLPNVSSQHPRQPSLNTTPNPSTVVGDFSGRPQDPIFPTAPSVPEPRRDSHAQLQGTTIHHPSGATLGESTDQQAPHAILPPSPRLQPTHGSMPSLNGSAQTSPSRIKVRDLSHIQSFASEEVLTRSRHPSRLSLRGRIGGGQQYEISSMPVQDIIEMVAGLLTKITTTNDRQHAHLHRHIPDPDGSTTLSQQAKSVLAFHGKNVPSITIASYLSRIHKYCPTTYEVFLSLLVYFDRMTEMVNSGSLTSLAENGQYNSRPGTAQSNASSLASSGLSFANPSSPTSQAFRPPQPSHPNLSSIQDHGPSSSSIPPTLSDADAYDISHFFVVDSFNIHRLVMAGVTCASKFFSDVFYTNSRYAKVGGLPLVELNHLELQFLLLNDFRLAVPIEELDAYGTMLVEFYAREVISQQQQQQQQLQMQQHEHEHEHEQRQQMDTHTGHQMEGVEGEAEDGGGGGSGGGGGGGGDHENGHGNGNVNGGVYM